MDIGRKVDPEWVVWAEDQTIKHLEAQLERRRTMQEGVAEDASPPMEPVTLLPAPPAAEIVQEKPQTPPSMDPNRWVMRSDGLRIRIHRDNVDRV